MTDRQPIGEILAQALNDIDDAGGRERHLLRDTIGQETYNRLIGKPKTADLIDRWLSATGKAKPAATKALSVAIAKTANRPELLKRIEREVGEAFDEPANDGTESPKSRPTPTKAKHGPSNGHGNKSKGVDLAALANRSDLSEYMKARQKGE